MTQPSDEPPDLIAAAEQKQRADAALPAAGWYPDPERAGTQRYWDGAAWTEHRTIASGEAESGGPES